MNDTLFYSILIGVAAGGFIFAALNGSSQNRSSQKALAVAAFSIGAAITWWLYNHPRQLEPIMESIVSRGIAIILAALGAALAFWRR